MRIGSLCEGHLTLQARTGLVRAQDIFERDDMRGRLNPLCVYLSKFVDMAEDR